MGRELLRLAVDADLAGFNILFDLQFLIAEYRGLGLDLTLAGRAVLNPMQIFHVRDPELSSSVKAPITPEE